MPETGNFIIQTCAAMLQESRSTIASQQNMLMVVHLRNTLDEIARKTFAIGKVAACDLLQGQVEYRLPTKPYRDATVCIKNQYGHTGKLDTMTVTQADEQFYRWRDVTAWTGPVSHYITLGIQNYYLFPCPQYSMQDGLLVSGYFGVGSWYDPNNEIPLPEYMEETVKEGVCYRRCRELATMDPDYKLLLPMYKQDYQTHLREMYRTAAGATEARRNGAIAPSSGRIAIGEGWSFL